MVGTYNPNNIILTYSRGTNYCNYERCLWKVARSNALELQKISLHHRDGDTILLLLLPLLILKPDFEPDTEHFNFFRGLSKVVVLLSR